MITRSPAEFLRALRGGKFPAAGPACARAVFMVEPAAFSVSAESALDNPYMDLAAGVDAGRALQQSRALAALIAGLGIEVIRFPGDPETPDAIFPNNVFATTARRFIIGRMRHPVRQKEAQRRDIRAYFGSRAAETVDLSGQPCIAELTGVLVIDYPRRIGFCGISSRVDEAGLEAMHAAFELKMTFAFELRPGEYHTNVVMMVLAGRACVIHPGSFVDPAAPAAVAEAFPGRTLFLDESEKNAFAANCIALTERDLFMSQTGVDALRPSSRAALEDWGFVIHAAQLDEIEKAGGSLRCMLAEIF